MSSAIWKAQNQSWILAALLIWVPYCPRLVSGCPRCIPSVIPPCGLHVNQGKSWNLSKSKQTYITLTWPPPLLLFTMLCPTLKSDHRLHKLPIGKQGTCQCTPCHCAAHVTLTGPVMSQVFCWLVSLVGTTPNKVLMGSVLVMYPPSRWYSEQQNWFINMVPI